MDTMDTMDPAIKSLVCDACWSSIFSFNGWQLALAAKQVPGRTGFSKGFSYNTTWEAIYAAAYGCSWCRFLARSGTRKGGLEVWIACDEDSDCTPAGEKKLTVVIHGDHSNDYFSFRQYYMYTNSDDKAAKYVAARDRILDVASPESHKLALECLDNCERTHQYCPKPPTDPILPDRVIDCSDVEKPRIVLTNDTQKGHYLTLSYVWGGDQPKTTSKNIDDFVSKGMNLLDFTQTIRDAVDVTRKIGQRYLWVDALCIIQDSDEDKSQQLPQMQRIYRNSYLTINAACARSSQEGFLHQKRPHKVPDARIPYRCPDGTVGSVWIAAQMDTDLPDASHSYWDELEPITHRGWCFQERMLPPRSLIYASDTLKYYCQTETVNIGHALCEPSTGMRLPHSVYMGRPSGTIVPQAEQIINRRAWLAVIFTYTVRKISHPSDKLVALAGVAELFGEVFKDQYLAGLWRKTLILDLLWKNGFELFQRPESYRAPSWSWASIDGLVQAEYIELSLLSDTADTKRAKIVDCEVTEKTPFGEVMGGVLTLGGFVKGVTLEGSGQRSRSVSIVKMNEEQEEIGYTMLDAKEERTQEVYVIPILWDAAGKFVKGLTVMKTDDGTYRRIGNFKNRDSMVEAKWLEGLDEQEIKLV